MSCRRGRSISSRDVHRHEAGETHSNYHADAVLLVFLGHSLLGRRSALLRSCRSTNLEEFSSNRCTLTTVTMSETYIYGASKRVQKSNGKFYWYGMGSDPLDETDLAGA